MHIETTIMVEPVPKARSRAMISKSGKRYSYTPAKTAHAENLIRDRVIELGKCFEVGVPIKLQATFYREKPKSLSKKVAFPVSRPDWDNYAKLLTDALEKFVYKNDSQITTATIKKRFGSPPRIELFLDDDGG